MHAICHDSVAIHSLSIHKLLNGLLAKLPANFNSFFTGYTNTTSTPIGVEDGGDGEPQSGGLKVRLN